MFEDEDCDFGDDFFQDMDDKTQQFFSQVTDETDSLPTKKCKVEVQDESFSSMLDASDSSQIETQNNEKELPSNNVNRMSRKNLVLEILKKNSTSRNKSDNTSKSSNKNILSERKNYVLSILQKKNLQDNSFSIKNGIGSCFMSGEVIQEKENGKDSPVDNTKRHLLLGSLEKPALHKANYTANNVQPLLPLLKLKKQPSEKQTLVRKFPGPAGLLPDFVDKPVPPVSYLKSLDESDNNEAGRTEESDLSIYCSQNTKNFFTEGAWQLMLDELPHGSLKLYTIAEMKQMASANEKNIKIPFLAGIVEKIDHSNNNPPIVLKDFTDNIEGIVHCDIEVKYPGILEPNTVILLHNIGLLKLSGYCVSSKYRILISPSNLLAIYTCKGKIVRTPLMHSIFNNVSSNTSQGEKHAVVPPFSVISLNKSEQERDELPQEISCDTNRPKSPRLTILNSYGNTPPVKAESMFSVKATTGIENLDNWKDLNDTDDFNFSVVLPDTTDTQCNERMLNPRKKKILVEEELQVRKLSEPSTLDREKESNCADSSKSKNLSDTLKKFSVEPKNVKKMSVVNIGKSDAEHPNTSSESINNSTFEVLMEDIDFDFESPRMDTMKQTTCTVLSADVCKDFKFSVQPVGIEHSEDLKNRCNTKPESTKQKTNCNIKEKLMQFRSNDISAPVESSSTLLSSVGESSRTNVSSEFSENDREVSKRTSTTCRDFSSDVFCDTDDEILSQVDVDTIFSNYNDQ